MIELTHSYKDSVTQIFRRSGKYLISKNNNCDNLKLELICSFYKYFILLQAYIPNSKI